jgi:hypothetical protein
LIKGENRVSRPFGTPLVKERIKLFVPKEWVLTVDKRRYVYLHALQPKIFTLSNSVYKSSKLSARFSQLLHRNMYNTKILYGIGAVDIDTPQSLAVSVELDITVGGGKDAVERIG